MTNMTASIRSIAIACALCAAAGSALAQTAKQKGDPARWYSANASKQQSLATIKKEINAAYAEQKKACAKGAGGERASCLAQARQTYRDDMANARQLVADAPSGSVSERVVSTDAGSGSSAVGASQGGSAGSGGGTAMGTAQGGDSASGGSGSGITASGGGAEMGAAPTGSAGAGVNGAAAGQAQPLEPQPMQPPAVSTPPRSEDTPIQR